MLQIASFGVECDGCDGMRAFGTSLNHGIMIFDIPIGYATPNTIEAITNARDHICGPAAYILSMLGWKEQKMYPFEHISLFVPRQSAMDIPMLQTRLQISSMHNNILTTRCLLRRPQ